MSGHRGVPAWVALTIACSCAPPSVGDPCDPGDAPFRVEGDTPSDVRDIACGFPYGECSGPGRWLSLRPSEPAPFFEYCGCDGATYAPPSLFDDPFRFGPPNRPWVYVGSCEEPCGRVSWLEGDGWVWDGQPLAIAPFCTCEDARAVDGDCLDSLGRRVAGECCSRCPDAVLDLEGVCHLVEEAVGRTDDAISGACCDECRAATFVDGRCVGPTGNVAPSRCCDCGDLAALDAAGQCVEQGIVIADRCCDCSHAVLDTAGQCTDSRTGSSVTDACCA